MRVLGLAMTVLATVSVTTSCQVGCIEDGSGTRCVAKSLDRFDGPVAPPLLFDRAPGAPVTIDVLYGNVVVQRSGSGKVEVQFLPFVYAGHDEKASADQQLAQNLRTAATAAGAVTVSVRREGGTNGLGSDVLVRLPDTFDGPLTVVNHGDGPLNNFDVKIEFLARATTLNVTNNSMLGICWIQGAPTVRSTTVQCGEDISVFDVSDDVTIASTETMHDPESPAVTLRLAAVSPSSRGGRITSASGAVAATFPRAGSFVLNARSPVKGLVQEGAVPPNCRAQAASPSQKTISCGSGPAYELVAGASPNYPVTPKDSNVIIAYQ
jgi:hypothetical protein